MSARPPLHTIETGYAPGCIGRIAQLHAQHYAAGHGFGVEFESQVAMDLAEFCLDQRPGQDGLWRLMVDGQLQGSVALDGHDADGQGAHLRWFLLSDAVRGQGLGRLLLQQALGLADSCGYRKVYLWTFAGLRAARHLYEQQGFRLVHESPGQRWGTRVTEQRFERVL